MDTEKYFGELDNERQRNRRLTLYLGVCIATILVLASSVRAQIGDERTHMLPPEISRPFWLSAKDASPEYFEDMGMFINGLPLNVTPDTVRQACKQYLTYVLPADRDLYKSKCDQDEARVKRDSVSQMFSVRQILTDAAHQRVAFSGTLHTFIGGKPFRRDAAYVMEFTHAAGRFYISNHKEAAPNDPLAKIN